MTTRQALELLGLTGRPSAEEVRRAYLRAVKQHPPERDAEGFRRVREAFDLLKQPAWLLYEDDETDEEGDGGEPPVPPDAQTTTALVVEQEHEVEQQVSELAALLQEEDPVVAAAGLLRLYRRPVMDPGPLPPPLMSLQVYLVLVERGHFAEAHELLEAFEAFAAQQRLDARDHAVGAHWLLAREVAELVQIDSKLASAVAAGLRSDNMGAAARAASSLDWSNGSLEKRLAQRTPNVWGRLSPLVQSQQVEQPGSSSPGFQIWWVFAIGALLFNMFNILTRCGNRDESRAREIAHAVAQATDRASLEAALKGPEVTMANLIDKQWSMLEAELEQGNCARVRTRWTVYQPLSRSNVDAQTTASRKQLILRTCPDLAELLEKP